jgi:hypothetical protein
MQRRKYLAAIGSLAAGGAAVTGTGAFTRFSGNRAFSINVASDSNALLAIEPEDTANGNYAIKEGDGTLSFDISSNNRNLGQDPGGVNNDGYTIFRDVFTITNQGTQPVYVGVDGDSLPGKSGSGDTDKAIGFFSDDPDKGAGLGVGPDYVAEKNLSDSDPLGLLEKGINLTAGETLNRCGFQVYTTDRDAIPNFSAELVAASPDELGE